MTKKTRFTILVLCILCFIVIAPLLVLYSEGYRFDFETMKITETGGIYVRTFPAADKITIDSSILEKPSIFYNSIFVQSLLPKNHTVVIQKNGYYDYFKSLPVEEGKVTKLENVLLIKNYLLFDDISDNISYFSIAPNNQNVITSSTPAKNTTFNFFSLGNYAEHKLFSIALASPVTDITWSENSSSALIKIQTVNNALYYLVDTTLQTILPLRLSYLDKNAAEISFNPQNQKELFYLNNNTIYSAIDNKALPIINNALSYKVSDNNIIWLSSRGALLQSDISGKLIKTLSSQNIIPDLNKNYQIIIASGKTFLKENNNLFVLNQDSKTFDNFISPTADYKILSSPDNQNVIYWGENAINLYSFADKKYTEIFSGDNITDAYWLNNNYIIFASGNKIVISEIDYRGNINTITLPSQETLQDNSKIDVKPAQIFFNRQDNKLYILSENNLIASEKLVP